MLLLAGCTEKEDRSTTKDTKPNDSGFVTVDGTKLRYLIEGTGIPCMVIGSTIFWPRTFSRELRQQISLIFIDTRLFVPSHTSVEVDKITMNTLVDDVEQVRKTLGFDKIAVLGHSAMGLLALEYARKYPEYTSHVIMIGTPAFWNNDRAREISTEYWETHASDERKGIVKRNKEKLTDDVLSKASPGEVIRMRYLADGPKWWYDPTYDGSWLWEELEVNADMWNHFFGVILNNYDIISGDKITTSVFLALGQYDYGVPYRLWDDRKNELPKLSYNLFEKSGHYPMMEEEALFDKNLIDWIKNE
jgi:proline iminopeptidase